MLISTDYIRNLRSRILGLSSLSYQLFWNKNLEGIAQMIYLGCLFKGVL